MSRPSVFDRLAAWWRRPVVRQTWQNACLEDPDGALAALQEEQGMIAQELEETFLAYDRRLRSLAERLASGEARPSKADVERLRQEQAELWRLVRRAQAAGRSTTALTQEFQEWKKRQASAVPPGHPDHPHTRAEIVASELRVRGVEIKDQEGEVLARPEQDTVASIPWSFESDEMILREIADRERELRRLVAASETDPSLLAEISLQHRELRGLHARLREIDRRNGISANVGKWG